MALRSASVAAAAAVVAVVLAVGCGSSDSSKGPGGQGIGGTAAGSAGGPGPGGGASQAGSSSKGGSGAGGGGTGAGGSLVLGSSLTDACIAYALANCGRDGECKGRGSQGCISATLSCPDVVASVGSTRTAESLRACAEEYRTYSCEALAAGTLPACVTPGTRQQGEPCAFHSQCATLVCEFAQGECGVCASRGALGADCTAPDAGCDFNLYCDDAGQCAPLEPPTPLGMEIAAGEPCTSADRCAGAHYCDSASQRCVAYPTLGMSCAERRSCVGGAYCELEGLTCQAAPGAGLPCGVDAFTGGAAYCADGLVCHRVSKGSGTCNAPPAAGQPCLLDPETQEPNPGSCGSQRFCDITATPAVCSERLAAGALCAGKGVLVCQSGLSCLCPQGSPLTSSCPTAVCGTLRFGTQSCAAPGEVCHPGFSCTGGVCVPRDSQGLFDATCGP